MHPLRFAPLIQRYLWGGRRLGAALGKSIGPESDYAESWEVVDHGEHQSRVAFGPLAGMTLHQLVVERGAALFGRHQPQVNFPLLLKYLDAARTLSVQVHPNDAQAARLDPPDLGKTEAWVVVEAEPGSRIFAGLRPGVDRAALAEAVRRGTCDEALASFEPRPGDCLFIPAGTVHALGAGLLVAEIQQSSNTTFRLFDWNRVGPDGRPRALHLQQALDVIDYARGPVGPRLPQPTDTPARQCLVQCDRFVLDRWQPTETFSLGGDDRFHLLTVLAGRVSITGDPAGRPLQRGDSLLLPAAVGAVIVEVETAGPATLLDSYLP